MSLSKKLTDLNVDRIKSELPDTYSDTERKRLEAHIKDLVGYKLSLDKINNSDGIRLLELLDQAAALQETSGVEKYFVPGTPYSIDNLPKHKAFFKATCEYRETLMLGGNRCGKALPDWEQIITPAGPIAIKDIRVGDAVIGSNGKPTKVLGTYPQGSREIYKITLSDSSEVFADKEHLWSVRNTKKGADSAFKVLTTQELDNRYALPNRPITEYNTVPLKIDPYLLGLLLGDGGLSAGAIRFSSADQEPLAYLKTQATIWNLELKFIAGYDYKLVSTLRDRAGYNCNPLYQALKDLNVTKLAIEKSIPEAYLYNSVECRLAILQGLMDTDGTASRDTGASMFYSSSLQLAEDVTQLARSLGIKATINTKYVQYKGEYRRSWAVYLGKTLLPLFRIQRKKALQKPPERNTVLRITKIEPAGESPCTCIEVAAEDKLFLMNNYIPTHNTTVGGFVVAVTATGLYPDWWEGVRYDGPVSNWAVGKTGQTTRDTVQNALLGPIGNWGTGLIPADCIVKTTIRQGIAGGVDTIEVRHVPTGKISTIGFKSYDQRPDSFYGTAKNVVWLDEPCPELVYNECLIRTMRLPHNPVEGPVGGRIVHTITPKEGLTQLLAQFLSSCDLLAGAERIKGLEAMMLLAEMEAEKND